MKTRLSLSQTELTGFLAAGETVILHHRKASEIRDSRNVKGLYLSPLPGSSVEQPYTQRGRFHAVTPEIFRSIQTQEAR